MTVIHLMTSDQELIAVQSPKLASGDVNTVQIKVDFDDHWNNFSKTATFIKEGALNGYEVVFVNGYATVPHEVLDEDGNIFIGVRGTNGANIKTSALVKYRVVKGAGSGEGSSTPTPTIYQQLLDAYASVESIAVDAKNTANNAKNTADNAQTTANNAMPKTIMVTETGTDLNDYKEEGIYCFPNSNYTPINIPVGVNGWLIVLPSKEGTIGTKQIWYRFGTAGSNSHQTYERLCGADGTWGAWTHYMTEKGGTFTGNVTVQAGKYIDFLTQSGAKLRILGGGTSDLATLRIIGADGNTICDALMVNATTGAVTSSILMPKSAYTLSGTTLTINW